jgi:hypothetical protein
MSRTTLRKACPPIHALRPQPGLEVRTKLVRLISAQTRVASPSVLAPCGIKPRSKDLGAGSLGQVAARFRDSLRATTSATASVFLPLEIPAWGYPKGIISDHHQFVGTRKGAPTNWAGTPDAVHLDLQFRFAKGNLRRFTPKTACNTLSGPCRSRIGSESRL